MEGTCDLCCRESFMKKDEQDLQGDAPVSDLKKNEWMAVPFK